MSEYGSFITSCSDFHSHEEHSPRTFSIMNGTKLTNDNRYTGSSCSSGMLVANEPESGRDGRMSLAVGSMLMCTDRSAGCNTASSKESKIHIAGMTEKRRKSPQFCYSGGDEAQINRVQDTATYRARKRAFILSLMGPTAVVGWHTCRLCHEYVWGPNGRYHIEKCFVLCRRRAAEEDGVILQSVNGIEIQREFFAQPKALRPKPAKIPGFVMSNSVLRSDQHSAPSLAQEKAGVSTGRKGYTRCLSCNAEIHAPNTKRHKAICPTSTQGEAPDKL